MKILNIVGSLLIIAGVVLALLGFTSDILIIIGVTSLLAASIVLRITKKQYQECCNLEEKIGLK